MINGTTASRDNRRPFYAVRIGVMIMQSPSKIELQKDRNRLLITPPPRLNGLEIKTQSFRRKAVMILPVLTVSTLPYQVYVQTDVRTTESLVVIDPR